MNAKNNEKHHDLIQTHMNIYNIEHRKMHTLNTII